MSGNRWYRMAGLIAILALAAFVPVGPASAQDAAETVEYRVPFLTLRNRTGTVAGDPVFGDSRSSLKAGTCIVRRLDLELFSPLAEAAPAYIREEFLRLAEVRMASPDEVLDGLAVDEDGLSPVLYVHGFNISFEKGCRRAALLQANSGTEGRFLWFSWPSDGALTNYTQDEADLYWSVPDLADAILGMEDRFGSERANVVGHSLGARGVVLALSEVAYRRPEARLGDVVLLAPDMDFDIFDRLLPRLSEITRSITVYVTSDDRPLALSAQLHGYPRLGQAGNDVSRLDGVEVIDLSNAPSDSPTGHLYHIYSPSVGEDLSQLLNDRQPAATRRDLWRAAPNVWKLLPGR